MRRLKLKIGLFVKFYELQECCFVVKKVLGNNLLSASDFVFKFLVAISID